MIEQQQALMMLMMHSIFMKLPNLVYKREVSIYENGSQTMRTCSIALMNMKSITNHQMSILHNKSYIGLDSVPQFIQVLLHFCSQLIGNHLANMTEAAETLVRLRGARKIYLRSIKNSERDILEMIENFSIDDENSTIKLTSAEVSLQDRINKVKQQDEEILKVLKTEDMEYELGEILIREKNLQILITGIEEFQNL